MSSNIPPAAIIEALLRTGDDDDSENTAPSSSTANGNKPLLALIAERRAALALAPGVGHVGGNDDVIHPQPSAPAATSKGIGGLGLPPLLRRRAPSPLLAASSAPSNGSGLGSLSASGPMSNSGAGSWNGGSGAGFGGSSFGSPVAAGGGAGGGAAGGGSGSAGALKPNAEVIKNFRLLKHANMLRRKAARALTARHYREATEALTEQALLQATAGAPADSGFLESIDPLSLAVTAEGFRAVANERRYRYLDKLVPPLTFAKLQAATAAELHLRTAQQQPAPSTTSSSSSPPSPPGASLRLLFRYMRSRIHLSNVARRLSHYDSEGDGCLREHDLENYVFESIGELGELSALQDNFYPFYVFTAVRKFFFSLDVHRVGRVRVRDILDSPILGEWLCLFPPDHPHLMMPDNSSSSNKEEGKESRGAASGEDDDDGKADELKEQGASKEGRRRKREDGSDAPAVPPAVKEAARKAAAAIVFSLDANRRVTTTTTAATANNNNVNGDGSGSGDASAGVNGITSGGSNDAPSESGDASATPAATTTTTVMSYVPAVLPVDEVSGIGSSNWFSAATAIRVYSQYLDLDQDQNGLLSPLELSRACNGTLSDAFIHRLFQSSNTYGGEMDFKAYLDFVLATEYRRTPAAMRYVFRALDVKGSGMLTLSEIRYFFSAVSSKMVSAGHEAVDAANVSDEIFDMVRVGGGNNQSSASTTTTTASVGRRRRPSTSSSSAASGGDASDVAVVGITLEDLLRCGVGHTVLQILTDAAGFWQYDNREWLVQQQQQQQQQMQMQQQQQQVQQMQPQPPPLQAEPSSSSSQASPGGLSASAPSDEQAPASPPSISVTGGNGYHEAEYREYSGSSISENDDGVALAPLGDGASGTSAGGNVDVYSSSSTSFGFGGIDGDGMGSNGLAAAMGMGMGSPNQEDEDAAWLAAPAAAGTAKPAQQTALKPSAAGGVSTGADADADADIDEVEDEAALEVGFDQ